MERQSFSHDARVIAADRLELVTIRSGRASAWEKSRAEANRSAGSFWSAVSTAASTWGGTVLRWVVNRSGWAVTTLATMDWAVGPSKGGSPASIS